MKHLVLLLAVLLPLTLAAQTSPAKTAPKASARRHINEPNRILPPGVANLPISDAVQVGNTVYLAGTIGLDPKTGKPPAAIEQEIHIALDNMKQTLAAANMTMDDLVAVQVFCSDLSLYDKFNAVYRTYFSKDFPARAFIGSGQILFGGHFEIMGIAVGK